MLAMSHLSRSLDFEGFSGRGGRLDFGVEEWVYNLNYTNQLNYVPK